MFSASYLQISKYVQCKLNSHRIICKEDALVALDGTTHLFRRIILKLMDLVELITYPSDVALFKGCASEEAGRFEAVEISAVDCSMEDLRKIYVSSMEEEIEEKRRTLITACASP